jgi:hypothetical protein
MMPSISFMQRQWIRQNMVLLDIGSQIGSQCIAAFSAAFCY